MSVGGGGSVAEKRATEAFHERFGLPPELLVRAPGRINLIGEHTDYNDGFVLPMAIDREVWIALRRRADGVVSAHSLDLGESASYHLGGYARDDGWLEYVKGVSWALSGYQSPLTGWEGVIAGDVPIGAGLASSAALEMAAARAFAAVSGLEWDAVAMARLARRAEVEWVGVNCGIMDQMISAAGEEGYAMLLDCRSLTRRQVAIPGSVSIVVLDTGTRRDLLDSAYNTRRAECEVAARWLGRGSLRDATVEDVATAAARRGDGVLLRRARHVVTENARTLRAADAMARDDAFTLGLLMNQSHDSLRDDFEVSSPALETMVALAREHPACYGARLTGAGFGGCAVAAVSAPSAGAFAQEVGAAYLRSTGLAATTYVCKASAGASLAPRT
jgi:galactokinase